MYICAIDTEAGGAGKHGGATVASRKEKRNRARALSRQRSLVARLAQASAQTPAQTPPPATVASPPHAIGGVLALSERSPGARSRGTRAERSAAKADSQYFLHPGDAYRILHATFPHLPATVTHYVDPCVGGGSLFRWLPEDRRAGFDVDGAYAEYGAVKKSWYDVTQADLPPAFRPDMLDVQPDRLVGHS